MTYVPIDTHFPTNPKVLGLSDSAFRVYVEAACYAKEHLTDGLITHTAGKKMHRRGKKVCDELVDSGLWREHPEGYEIHGWLGRNKSRAEVEEMARLRAKSGHLGGKEKANRAKQTSSKVLAKSKQTSGKTLAKSKQTPSKTPSKIYPEYRVQSTEGEANASPRVEPKGSTIAPTPPRNEHWDAMEAVFHYSPAGDEAKLWGKLCRDYREMGLTGPDILEASRLYDRDMGDVAKTPTALRKHAQRLLANPARRGTKMSPRDLLDLGAQLGRSGDSTGTRRGEGRLPELGPAA